MQTIDDVIGDLELMAHATNYRNWIFGRFSPYLGKRIMEVGAGIGSFTDILSSRELVVSIDTHPPAIEYLTKRFKDRQNIIPLEMDIANPDSLQLKKYNLDTCVCINVLEHVENDEAALHNIHEALSHGGVLALLVPAFMFLYGDIDRLVGHKRRYTKKELGAKLKAAGFDILKLHYMNMFALPGWFLNKILHRKTESISQILLFDRFFVPWIKKLENIFTPPFGLSVIAICRKKS